MNLLTLAFNLPPLEQLTALVGLVVSGGAAGALLLKAYRVWEALVLKRHQEQDSLSWVAEHREELEELIDGEAPKAKRHGRRGWLRSPNKH